MRSHVWEAMKSLCSSRDKRRGRHSSSRQIALSLNAAMKQQN
jgi:hypothetical protein